MSRLIFFRGSCLKRISTRIVGMIRLNATGVKAPTTSSHAIAAKDNAIGMAAANATAVGVVTHAHAAIMAAAISGHFLENSLL